MRKNFLASSFFCLSVFLSFGFFVLANAEWQPPNQAPPFGQPAAPLDESEVSQGKIGTLKIENFDQVRGDKKTLIILDNAGGQVSAESLEAKRFVDVVKPIREPGKPGAGFSRLYFDGIQLKVSYNGGVYQALGGGDSLWKSDSGLVVNVPNIGGVAVRGAPFNLVSADNKSTITFQNNNDKLSIISAGNLGVGIGTSDPKFKLDVAGKLNATEVCINGVCSATWPAGGPTTGAGNFWQRGINLIYYGGSVVVGGNQGIGGSLLSVKGNLGVSGTVNAQKFCVADQCWPSGSSPVPGGPSTPTPGEPTSPGDQIWTFGSGAVRLTDETRKISLGLTNPGPYSFGVRGAIFSTNKVVVANNSDGEFLRGSRGTTGSVSFGIGDDGNAVIGAEKGLKVNVGGAKGLSVGRSVYGSSLGVGDSDYVLQTYAPSGDISIGQRIYIASNGNLTFSGDSSFGGKSFGVRADDVNFSSQSVSFDLSDSAKIGNVPKLKVYSGDIVVDGQDVPAGGTSPAPTYRYNYVREGTGPILLTPVRFDFYTVGTETRESGQASKRSLDLTREAALALLRSEVVRDREVTNASSRFLTSGYDYMWSLVDGDESNVYAWVIEGRDFGRYSERIKADWVSDQCGDTKKTRIDCVREVYGTSNSTDRAFDLMVHSSELERASETGWVDFMSLLGGRNGGVIDCNLSPGRAEGRVFQSAIRGQQFRQKVGGVENAVMSNDLASAIIGSVCNGQSGASGDVTEDDVYIRHYTLTLRPGYLKFDREVSAEIPASVTGNVSRLGGNVFAKNLIFGNVGIGEGVVQNLGGGYVQGYVATGGWLSSGSNGACLQDSQWGAANRSGGGICSCTKGTPQPNPASNAVANASARVPITCLYP